jgi:hypothetical protein
MWGWDCVGTGLCGDGRLRPSRQAQRGAVASRQNGFLFVPSLHPLSGPSRFQFHCIRPLNCASLIMLSRSSHLFFSSPPRNCPTAAMSVQPNAVARKATPYMVLYCLTPPQFPRYSSLTLCPPFPAWGENDRDSVAASIEFPRGGILLVNSFCAVESSSPTPISRKAGEKWGTSRHQVRRSLRCSN